MNADQYPIQRDDVLTQEAAGTTVLLDPASGEYFSLEEAGGRIWELCDGDHTVEEIVEHLARAYDAPEHRIREDVEVFLEDMLDADLIDSP